MTLTGKQSGWEGLWSQLTTNSDGYNLEHSEAYSSPLKCVFMHFKVRHFFKFNVKVFVLRQTTIADDADWRHTALLQFILLCFLLPL